MKSFFGKIFGNRVLGAAYILALVAGVYLTYAIFTKQFTAYDEVTLKAESAGLQLPSRADVKLRGKFVGEVLEVKGTNEGATITLGMYPDEIDKVPADVQGALLPKTLFGEKFVDLQVTDGLGGPSLQAGDTIQQAKLPTEIEDVLESVFPLLRTVEPAQINFTLNALATALEGRGEMIGEGLVTANTYLTRLNPELPQAIEDLRLLDGTADVYAGIAPQLGTILRNTVLTTGTLEEREQQLQATLDQVAELSGTTRTFLDENGENLITTARLGRRQTDLLAFYSPEFQCLLRGLTKQTPMLGEAFRNNTLHINLELLPNQPRGYTTGDRATFGARQKPTPDVIQLCNRAVDGAFSQSNLIPRSQIPDFDDGVNDASLGKRAAVSFQERFNSSSDLAELWDVPLSRGGS
ncbi:MCE family protein [Nocardioidaceae bacterium]|nr:MCE family protein [Nocardioidaceae bacterium]